MNILKIEKEKRIDGGALIDTVRVFFSGTLPGILKDAIGAADELGETWLEEEPLEVSAVLIKKGLSVDALISELEEERRVAAELIEENKELSDRVHGLMPPPESGALWDEKKRYINGDIAKDEGKLFKAQCYSRGKKPSISASHWEWHSEETVEPINWDEIQQGTMIQVGIVVFYDNQKWRCMAPHTKKRTTRPGEISDFWQKIQ